MQWSKDSDGLLNLENSISVLPTILKIFVLDTDYPGKIVNEEQIIEEVRQSHQWKCDHPGSDLILV